MKHLFLLLLFTSLYTISLGQAGGENCASATVITSIPFVGTGSTSAAVNDYNETCPDVGNQGNAKDVVYKYTTGSAVEYVSLTLCIAATNYDSQLYVYQGSCASGTSYACQEDGCQSPAYNNAYNSEILDLMLQANTDYYFVVDGYSSSASGNYQLNVDPGVAPPTTQITFADSSQLLPTSTIAARSGSPMAISDMNNDGLDDIIRLHNSQTLLISYQQTNGTFTEISLGNIAAFSKAWAVCIADVDSNGYNDIVTGDYNDLKLFTANSTGTGYTQTTINTSSIFAQGMNFVDINNDALIDFFSCNDVGESHLYLNSATGLSRDFTTIDFTTTPVSDKSGNYASMFTDLDDDGDLDLYITKCRQGVTNTSDGRRINQWIENTGSGMWTENTTTILRDSAQGWVTDFGDIDNDGDLDAFIVNHDQVSRLYRNLGNGVFEDYTTASGLTQTGFAGIQTYWRDFNNDGWLDLLMTGSEHRLWINNQDTSFTLDINPFAILNDWMLSAVVGDLNHDGFLDIYASYGTIFNTASLTATDRLWINQGASGFNFLQVNLDATASNVNAIGAKIKAYGPWGVQVREVRAGEGYGTQNSFTQHFGLGSETNIDSMIVYWPSGIIDYLYNVSANQWLTVVEGSFPAAPVVLSNGNTSNITTTSADIDLSMELRVDFNTDVLFHYWPEGGTTQIVPGGIYNLNGGGTQVFNPSTSLNGLISDTTYHWTALAYFDPGGQNLVFTYDTLSFNTLPVTAPFDSIPMEITNLFGVNSSLFQADLTFDVLLREDSLSKVEMLYWLSGASSPTVDSVTTLSLMGGGTQTFPLNYSVTVPGAGIYSFAVRGTFAIEGSNELYYSDTLEILIAPDALNEFGEDAIKIYPQPTQGSFTVQLNAQLVEQKPVLELYSADGKRIQHLVGSKEMNSLNIEGESAGVYLLMVTLPSGDRGVYKVVKQ